MRKPRLEIEGGLYHIISRGNYRQRIFSSRDDYLKFLLLLAQQKAKLPFYLYSYCLMPNHFHLLIERRDDSISRVMQRLLTAYSRYYHRRQQRSGHLLQGRYKAILCQTDRYLAELVRYIHLNPVRAKIVCDPEDFEHSSHRAYLGCDPDSLVDTEPLLRHFGATKKLARERFTLFVRAAIRLGHQKDFYQAEEGRILGSEEFVTDTKKRIGEIPIGARPQALKPDSQADSKALLSAVANLTDLKRGDICSANKSRPIVLAKEAMIVAGRSLGVTNAELARLIGIDSSVASRRYESAKSRMADSVELRRLVEQLLSRLGGPW
jgi:REP element-mobilizing transposase RayT